MDTQTIKVNMLGEFSISGADSNCTVSDQNNRSKKVLTLLEYLLTFRTREISQNELIELMWPDDDTDEPVNTLKTLLHRTRAALDGLEVGTGKDLIICRRGTYAWNNSFETIIDAEVFERYCRQAENGTDEERLGCMLEAIKLYKGDFLPKSATELWAVPLTTYYHTLYLHIVHEAVKLLSNAGKNDEIVSICQRAVTIDPFDEQLHLSMIRALVDSGMQQAAMSHYNHVTELFMDKFGITPSTELTALYKDIVKATNSTEMNLGIIRDELRECEKAEGAFYCEYEIFKDVYRLQARAAARTGSVVQIALMSIDESGKKLKQKQMSVSMQRLKETISVSLRTSDVFSRYSVSQYIIMLPCASVEDSDMVLERIRNNFRKSYPHMNLMFHYTALPMEPVV